MSIDYQNFKKDKKPKKEYGYAPGGDLPKEVSNLMQYTDTADNKYFVYRTYDGAIQFYIHSLPGSTYHQTERATDYFLICHLTLCECQAYFSQLCCRNLQSLVHYVGML